MMGKKMWSRSYLCTMCEGCKFFKVYKNLSQRHPFLSCLPSIFLPCKDTFMDNYDGIYNCNSPKYNPSENFENF